MKFHTAIVPVVATLCTVLANGEASYGRVPTAPKPVSFTEEGLNNAINVGIQSPKGNQAQSVTQAIAFFKRNPSVVKSIMAEADKKEHTAAKTEAVKMFMGMYKAKDQVDLYDAKLKAVSYAYEHPEFLDLVQKVIFRVTKENPTLVDNLFTTASQVAKNDPSLGAAAKEHVIKFSETNPTEYKQITEMVLKTALVDPTWASNIFVKILKVDLITCQGAAQGGGATCDCKDGEYPAITDGTPSTTSPTTPEPTPIDEENGVGAEGEGSVDENTSPIPGDYSTPDGGETEGNGEITDETTPVPGDYSSPDAVDTSSPEGEGSVDPEEEEEEPLPAINKPSIEEVTPGEGEGSVETETEPGTEGGAEEALEYSRPSPPKPASYARPAVAAK